MSSFQFYFLVGLRHVLSWNAYDHLLFLLVLTVPYTFKDWKRIGWLITVFTIGHTLSLLLAVYGILRIGASLVEFLIPVTIVITALFNLFTAGAAPKNERLGLIFFVTLFFGLLHGLGFSTYFRQMVVSEENKLLPLGEFALGIEAAQLLTVLGVLILSFVFQSVFRFTKRDWVMVVSAMVLGMAIPMLVKAYPKGLL
jgi:hypothetical protein